MNGKRDRKEVESIEKGLHEIYPLYPLYSHSSLFQVGTPYGGNDL